MNYEAIQHHIDAARIQRSIYLAELIADGLIAAGKYIAFTADVLLAKARTTTYKAERNIFTFDA